VIENGKYTTEHCELKDKKHLIIKYFFIF